MKALLQQKSIMLLLLTIMMAGAFSFKSFAGGDAYEIYLNNKLVCRQQYKLSVGSKDLHLGKLNANDRLVIKYSHCGEIGKSRSIVVKDEKNNIIKEWKFTDTDNNQSVMSIPVKELLALTTKDVSLKLCYSAKQLPEGRVLAAITIDDKKVVSNNLQLSPMLLHISLKY